jgi:hypothetical protein
MKMLSEANTAESILEVMDLARSLENTGQARMIEMAAKAKKEDLENIDDDLPTADEDTPDLTLE